MLLPKTRPSHFRSESNKLQQERSAGIHLEMVFKLAYSYSLFVFPFPESEPAQRAVASLQSDGQCASGVPPGVIVVNHDPKFCWPPLAMLYLQSASKTSMYYHLYQQIYAPDSTGLGFTFVIFQPGPKEPLQISVVPGPPAL